MKQYLDSIKDMYKTIAQEELNSLFELIDARSDALDKKKEYYDYDKTIKSKTKDIRSLESQIAALDGVSTAEAKAKRARLSAELAEAREDLESTQLDHSIQISKESLSNLKTTLQEEFDDKWNTLGQNLDEVTALLENANQLTSANTAVVSDALNSLLSFYGISTSRSGITAHASGIRRVSSSHIGLTNESGSEILVTKYGLISKFNPGDGVVPSDLTERLYTLAQSVKPNSRVGGADLSGIAHNNGNVGVVQNYDSLIHIDGSADAATVEDLKNLSSNILEKSYEYTSRRITRDYVKTGGRRIV